MILPSNEAVLEHLRKGGVLYSPVTRIAYKSLNGKLYRQSVNLDKGNTLDIKSHNWTRSYLKFHNTNIHSRVIALSCENSLLPPHKVIGNPSQGYLSIKML